jgi:hypothetical protein
LNVYGGEAIAVAPEVGTTLFKEVLMTLANDLTVDLDDIEADLEPGHELRQHGGFWMKDYSGTHVFVAYQLDRALIRPIPGRAWQTPIGRRLQAG